MEVGSPQGVLDQSCAVVNQFNTDVILTIGTCSGQIPKQVGDTHALAILYKGLCAVGRQTDPLHIFGYHFSVLPD